MSDERPRPSPRRHIIIYEQVVLIRRRPEQEKKSVQEIGCLGNAILLVLKVVLIALAILIFCFLCSFYEKMRY